MILATMIAIPASAGQVAATTFPITEAPSEEAALAAAKATGNRVEVASHRTELTQVFAEPSGRLTYEAAVLPQRAKRADGSWAPLDLALSRRSDGTWRP